MSVSSLLESGQQKKFLKALLSWFKINGRHDMPWRKTKDPYAVFVSEFMLQQTTVATVRPYYDRFLARFPTLPALAESDLNDVLALWSGLGYYARARNLWNAMRAVQEKHKGKIPDDLESLIELPGVGPYTAGAISAFAFNRPAPVLDGNIIRVFMRVLAIEDDPKLKAVQIILKKIALDISNLSVKNSPKPRQKTGGQADRWKAGGPRDVNLALMDIGATICLPKNPKCGECPAHDFCLARVYNRQNDIPMKGEKVERPTVRRLCAIVQNGGKWLMGQRPAEGLFGGLWEFPGVDAPAGADPINLLEESILQESGLKIQVETALPAFEHQLSHRIMVIRAYLSKLRGGGAGEPVKAGARYEKFRWISPFYLNRLGVSSITKRVVTELQALKNSAS